MKKNGSKDNFLILFDFDGTLVDTMPAHSKLAAEVINKYFGINKKLAYKKYIETSGLPFEKQLEIIFPSKKHKQKREKCAKEYVNRKVVDVYQKVYRWREQ